MMRMRKLSAELLRLLASHAPEADREWAQGMQSEANYIKSDLEAAKWSAACCFTVVSCIAKHWLKSESFSAADLRRRTKYRFYLVSVCLLLVFFLATPVVREGLVSTWQSWATRAVYSEDHDTQSVLRDPRSSTDASALAYLALRSYDPAKAERYAAEAVARDSRLTWIYAPLSASHARAPEAKRWSQALVQWDPSNAYAYAAMAQVIRTANPKADEWSNAEWIEAMKKAYAADRYDDYLIRRLHLQQEIIQRYGTGSLKVATMTVSQYPLIVTDWMRYGKKLAKGTDEDGWWAAFLFGQKAFAGAETDLECFAAAELMRDSQKSLVPALMSQGRVREASLMSQQLAAVEHARRALSFRDELEMFHGAPVVHAMSIFGALSVLVLVCTLFAYIRARVNARPMHSWKPIVGISLAVLVTASIGVYVGFRPYYELYRTFATGGNVSPRQLFELSSMYFVPWMVTREIPEYVLRVWTWYAVIAVGLAGLLMIAWRQRGRLKHA